MRTLFLIVVLSPVAWAGNYVVKATDIPGVPSGSVLTPCGDNFCNAVSSFSITIRGISDRPTAYVPQPAAGVTYWYVDNNGGIASSVYGASILDLQRFNLGNFYYSSAAATAALAAIGPSYKSVAP